MVPFSILYGGLSTPHDPAWVCQRPRGLPHWLLLCFATPYWMETRRGSITGVPGDVWVIPPHAPHTHGTPRGRKDGFVNDWIHFQSNLFEGIVGHYRIPVETPIPTGRRDTLTEGIGRLLFESGLKRPFYQEAMRVEMEGLLVRLGRLAALPGHAVTGTAPRQHLGAFQKLRAELRSDPSMDFSVPMWAARVSLSPSRFSVLWRQFFGVSPADDHLQIRLDMARGLLAGSGAPVGRVAELTGFESPMYFSRIFRKRVGTTPSAYRIHQGFPPSGPGLSGVIEKVGAGG